MTQAKCTHCGTAGAEITDPELKKKFCSSLCIRRYYQQHNIGMVPNEKSGANMKDNNLTNYLNEQTEEEHP